MRILFSSLFLSMLLSAAVTAELSPEKIPRVATLPADYPASWVFAHDANFDSLLTGKVVIVDVAADSHEYKGAIDAAQFATFIESSTRSELYVAESFYARGTRGERTDAVTIYDKATLKRSGEIILPGKKRAQIVTNKFATQLIDNDNYLLVFNFTPASSVTVIDVEKRAVLNEIPIPGCSMIYPTGERGFSSLCGDGSLLSIALNEKGAINKQEKLPAVFNVDDDPLFDKPAFIGEVAYFPSFKGGMQAIRLAHKPKVLPSWSLISEEDAKDNWRPSGWQIISATDNGHLYVLMQKNGSNGSHKEGGEEVWGFAAKARQRIRRIALNNAGFSIEVTAGKQAFLVVTNVTMGIDVYSLDGKLQRHIGDAGAMPIILHAKR